MKRLAAVLLLAAGLGAGPVGDYLGFAVGRVETTARSGRDSVHYLLPSPSDSVITSNTSETTTVVAETLIGLDPAWVSQTIVTGDTSHTSTDTAYESGDSLLYANWRIGDSICVVPAYRVPFAIGAWWRTGLAGTYLADVNGDTLVDTLTIWADTTRVIDTASVTVPYGTVPHCWVLRTSMRQAIAMTYLGVPSCETSLIRSWEWYKDSLWRVKDSTAVTGSGYAQIYIWLHVADFVMTSVGQLQSLATGISGRLPAAGSGRESPVLSPNPCRDVLLTSARLGPGTEIRVFDIQGRVVRSLAAGPATMRIPLDGLPAGAYVVQLSGPGRNLRQSIIKAR